MALVVIAAAWLRWNPTVLAYLTTSDPIVAFWAYLTLFGALLLGAIPTVIYNGYRLVMPSLVIVALFAAAVYGTWEAVQPGPVWVGPLPLTGYFLLWFVVLAVAFLAGAFEYWLR